MSEKHVDVPFEEALNRTGFGRYNYFMLVLCGSLVTSMVFEGMSMSFLVPASACEFKTTSVQQGLMAGMPLIGVIATSHMWGYLADTRGRRPVLAASLILGFSLAIISTLSPNWIVFSILKVISCSAVSGTYALSITLLSECTPLAKRGTMVILTTGLFMGANGIMAGLAIPILPMTFSYTVPLLNIQFNSWRLLAMLFTVPCLLGSIGIYSAWESPKYLVSAGRQEEAIIILKKIYSINHGGRGEDGFKLESIVLEEQTAGDKRKGFWRSIVTQTLPLLKPPLLKSTCLISFMFFIIYFCANPYHTWLPAISDGIMRAVQAGQTNVTLCDMLRYSQEKMDVETPQHCSLNAVAMTMVIAFCTICALLNVAVSFIIPYYGRKRLLITVQVISGVCGICINFSTNWIVSSILLIVYVLTGVNFGILTTFTVDIYPTYLRAMAVCLSLMVGRISAMIGINIVKELLVSNCELSFYIFGSLTAVGSFMALLLPSEKKNG